MSDFSIGQDRDDFIAGCIGGAAGVFVGHPFDTIKLQRAQDSFTDCEKRLQDIEQSLRVDTLSPPERQKLLKEKQKLKKALSEHDEEVTDLRRENRKTMLMSVLAFGLIYGLYAYVTMT